MWIKGVECLINTESMRSVDVWLVAPTSEKWELCVGFKSLDLKSNLVIDVYDTKEEATAGLDRFFRMLTGDLTRLEWEEVRH